MKNNSIVYVQFPKTGLGNLLLVWARARIFAEINSYELITSRWWGIRWGAILRKENKKRLYLGYFQESSLNQRIRVLFYKFFKKKYYEPLIQSSKKDRSSLFVFNKVIVNDDLFKHIREHREFIRQEIFKMLNPELLKLLNSYAIPEISVHIRRGDFKYGNPLTPLKFFIDSINIVREKSGYELPVSVFTDADKKEISEIFLLPNVFMAEEKPDILDILLMSKSKVIILSQSSTFSYWAAFLSEAIIVKPINDWQNNLRDEETNRKNFEGKVSFEENEGVGELVSYLSAVNSKAQF